MSELRIRLRLLSYRNLSLYCPMKPPSTDAISRAIAILLDSVRQENRLPSFEYVDPIPILVFNRSSSASRSVAPQSVSSLDAEAEALSTIRSTLNDEISPRISSLLQLRNSLSPLHHLPPELLCDISMMVLQDARSVRRVVELSTLSVFWRRLLLRSPRMWSMVELGRGGVGLALERSCQAPLEVAYDSLTASLDTNLSLVLKDLRLVGQHVSRWRSLSLTATMDILLQLNTYFTSPLLMLEVLELRNTSWPQRQPTLAFQGGSRLTRLTIKDVPLNWRLLTLSRLRELHLDNVRFDPDSLLSMLASAPLIEQLHVRRCRSPFNQTASAATLSAGIQASHLRDLWLEAVDGVILLALGDAIIAENLSALGLKQWKGEDGSLLLPAFAQSRRASCSLMEAVLRNTELTRLQLTVTLTGILTPITLTAFTASSQPLSAQLLVGLSGSITSLLDVFHSAATAVPLHVHVEPRFVVPFPITDLTSLTKLPNLTSLELDDGLDCRELVNFLSRPQMGVGGFDAWPCPDLGELRLANPYGPEAMALLNMLVDVRGRLPTVQAGEGAPNPGGLHPPRLLHVYLGGELHNPVD